MSAIMIDHVARLAEWPLIQPAIDAADRKVKVADSSRAVGLVFAAMIQIKSLELDDEVCQHVYNVMHSASVQTAEHAATDEAIPCGEWCSGDKELNESVGWAPAFDEELSQALEARGAPVTQPGDQALLTALAFRHLLNANPNYQVAHIAHSFIHMFLDRHVPEPVKHSKAH